VTLKTGVMMLKIQLCHDRKETRNKLDLTSSKINFIPIIQTYIYLCVFSLEVTVLLPSNLSMRAEINKTLTTAPSHGFSALLMSKVTQ